ncbi:SPI-2 type III secretion system effector SifA [Salmonella enterica]|nr:SPI-2 type III secretion system effector SifA [Salmonella enterica]
MPIVIGNSYLKSEILATPPGNARESCWKILWEKIKDFFFSTGKTKAESYLREMCFTDTPPTRERLTEIFFGLRTLACASQTERFQVYNPLEDDSILILCIVDENGGDELLRITQSADTCSYTIMGKNYPSREDRPGVLKSHPQTTLTINKRYSEVIDYPLPSTLCLNVAGAPSLSVPLDNLDGYLYSEWRRGNLDEWKKNEKVNYLTAKIKTGIDETALALQPENISDSIQQKACLKAMSQCGIKLTEIPAGHTAIEKMVKQVLLSDRKFQQLIETHARTGQSMLAEIIEEISDATFRAIFKTDPRVVKNMAGEQLTSLCVRSTQQHGCGLCCFL